MKRKVWALLILIFLTGCSNRVASTPLSSTASNPENVMTSKHPNSHEPEMNKEKTEEPIAPKEPASSQEVIDSTSPSLEPEINKDKTEETISSKDPIVSEEIIDSINTRVEQFVQESQFSGSILVSYKGSVLIQKAFGMADQERNIKNTTDSRFMIASITKQFTAMCILLLEEQGKISCEDTVDKFIPEFPMGKSITIHQLLTHTSGLPLILPNSRDNDYIQDYPGKTLEDKVINGIQKGDIKVFFSPPGSSFHYSDVNYMVLTLIIEKVSGTSFEAFMKANIFEPLDMKNTGMGYEPDNNPQLSVGYGPHGNKLNAPLSCADMSGGAGSMYSTVQDLYQWNQALSGDRLINSKLLEKMFTRYSDTYGYGWWFWDTPVGLLPLHGGRLLNGTFSGFYTRNPINNSCVILLGNDGDHDEKRDFAKDMLLLLMTIEPGPMDAQP